MADWKTIGKTAKNLTFAGMGKAKDMGEAAKLNLDNVSQEENRKQIMAEIGKLYVALHETPEGAYEELYRQLAQVDGQIAANKARLAELKD